MRIRHCITLGLVLAWAGACATDLNAPSPELKVAGQGSQDADQGADRVSVMTQNMYIGADVDAVIGALASPDPDDDLPALLTAIQTLGATEYPLRAAALANEVARQRPDVIGLQEVSQVHVDLTALGLPVTVDLDFLPTLMAQLSSRGLHYEVAATVQNIVANPFPGISVVDYDAILVETGRVTLTSAQGAPYSSNIGVVAPGVELKRGWVAVRATIGGRLVTIASTHLESGADPQIQQLRAAQAIELTGLLAADPNAIIMGDLNDQPGSLMYQVFAGAGYADSWASLRPGVDGLTCCEVADLSNRHAVFDQRIDFVLVRGLTGPHGNLLGTITRVGDLPADRVRGPAGRIWPSDHAGLAAAFVVPAPTAGASVTGRALK